MKALVDQEGKLERQNRAEANLNQNTENYKGSEESRREERRQENDINYRGKGNKTIKIGAYNNKEVTRRIHKILIEEITKNKKNMYYTILEDFNTVLSERLDMSSEGRRSTDTGTRVTKWLKNTDHIKTFWFCNLELIKYSWSNGNVSTRIDHIWTTHDMKRFILDSNIEGMETVTDSDHGIVWIQLDSSGILEKNKQRSRKGQKETRRLYLYHKATEENWSEYSQEVEKIIRNATKRKKKNRYKVEEESELDIDEE